MGLSLSPDLYIGQTLAIFKLSGTEPVKKLRLHKSDSGSAIIGIICFITNMEMLSKLVELLFFSELTISLIS